MHSLLHDAFVVSMIANQPPSQLLRTRSCLSCRAVELTILSLASLDSFFQKVPMLASLTSLHPPQATLSFGTSLQKEDMLDRHVREDTLSGTACRPPESFHRSAIPLLNKRGFA